MDHTKEGSGNLMQLPPKHRIFQTLCSYIMFISLGMAASFVGPTLVNMEMLLNTDTVTMGLALSFSGGGFLGGAFLCGLIFDRFNSELQFIVSSFVEGAALMMAPFSHSVYAFIALLTCHSIGRGFIDTAGSAYILTMWNGHRLTDSLMQALHLMFTIGSALAPFAISPFLSELYSVNSTYGNVTVTNHSYTEDSESASVKQMNDLARIRFAYVVVGGCCCLGGLLFIVIFFINGATCSKIESHIINNNGNINSNRELATLKLCFKMIFMLFLFLFYFFYLYIEGIPAAFISVFVIKGFDWSVHMGAMLTSVFWAAMGVGRLLGVPLSLCVPPEIIISINLLLVCAAYILMLFIESFGKPVMFASVAIAGLGLGPMFAGQMVWASKFLPFTGLVAAVCTVGASFGKISAYALTGYVLGTYDHMCMVYIVLAASIILIVLFFFMNLFAKSCMKRIVDIVIDNKEMEKL